MTDRRPIAARNTRLASRAARALADAGVRPNQISIASVIAAGAGSRCLVATRGTPEGWRYALFLIAAASIPVRLLCNMFDGMVAVEFGSNRRLAPCTTNFRDRIADTVLLVGAGYAVADPAWVPAVGWLAALLALLTAYVRTLGASLGVGHDFSGPLAKQQRMAVLAMACVLVPIEIAWTGTTYILTAALIAIAAGSALTAARRTTRMLRKLESG